MSELDKILDMLGASNIPGTDGKFQEVDPSSVRVVKQAIKDLVLELVGEPEEVTRIDRKTDADVPKEAVNDFKAGLRRKVEAL